MQNATIPFEVHLDRDEKRYTSVSLEETKREILVRIDIVELAKRLGLGLRKLNSDEYSELTTGLEPVYLTVCPRCGEESLLIAYSTQSFGCNSCHWEGLYTDGMDAFDLLEHTLDKEFPYGMDSDLSNQKMIEKLFELFPEELGFLTGIDPYRYHYAYNYFQAAEGYYPEITSDFIKLQNQLDADDRIMRQRNRTLEDNFYRSYHANRAKLDELKGIVQAYGIVSQIYTREERVQNLLSTTVKPEDIGLTQDPWIEPEEESDLLEARDSIVTDKPLKLKSVGFHADMRQDREYKREYFEIPDATFHTSINFIEHPALRNSPHMRAPVRGEYVIGYSKEVNNFSVFLSDGIESPLGDHIMERHGMLPLIIQTHIGHVVHSVETFNKKAPINLPNSYKRVASGGWVYSPAGLYFAFSKHDTEFDIDLFRACMEDLPIPKFPIFFDASEYIRAFREEEKKRNIPPPLHQGLHVERCTTYEVV